MSYIRAEDVLPSDVLAVVWQYIDGEILYVPKKESNQKPWGSVSGTKEYYSRRNALIYADYLNGIRVSDLAKKYFLSEKSIQRIIRRTKTMQRVIKSMEDVYLLPSLNLVEQVFTEHENAQEGKMALQATGSAVFLLTHWIRFRRTWLDIIERYSQPILLS